MNIFVHGTMLGPGGIAHHTREFTKRLAKYHNLKFRNFNIPKDWNGYQGENSLKNCEELEDVHHQILHSQTLYENSKKELKDHPLSGYNPMFSPDINLVMAEVNHHYYFQDYEGLRIAYFPWETTLIPENFLKRLDYFHYIWVPSHWQKEILINQGVESEKIAVVPEGVDETKFYPIQNKRNKKFTCLHIGTWEYRKSTYEIIKAWQNNFHNKSDVELRLSINNKFREQENEIETFKKFGLEISDNIVFLGTLSEEDYVQEIRSADLYLSCARGEGWNLPLIQAMASGVPALFSKCGGQLEFTEFSDLGIEIVEEYPCDRKLKINEEDWYWNWGQGFPGNLYEPDFAALQEKMMEIHDDHFYANRSLYPAIALIQSTTIREDFSWDEAVKKANKILRDYFRESEEEVYYKVHSKSFGDTLAATPTLRKLSKSYGKKINVVAKNKKAFQNNPYVKDLLSFEEFDKLYPKGEILESFTYAGKRDQRGIEKKFAHIDIRQIHAMDLGFQLLPHEMEYDFFPSPPDNNFELPKEYIVLHVTSNWPNRTWDYKNWEELIRWLSEKDIYTVLIGQDYNETLHKSVSNKPLEKKCPQFENLYGKDLTNKGTLDDMWHVINKAKCIVTMDTGPLHIAGCTDTHIIQLGSAIHPSLRAPYRKGDQNYNYDYVLGTCDLFCNSNLKYNVQEWKSIHGIPPLHGCLENYSEFRCHPSVDQVKKLIEPHFENHGFKVYFWYENQQIRFNFVKDTREDVKLVARDSLTQFKSDEMKMKMKRLPRGKYYWWVLNGDMKHPRDVEIEVHQNGKIIETHCIKREDPQKYSIGNVPIDSSLIYAPNDNIYVIFWEIFILETYKHEIVKVEKDDVVLDIGANYGFFTFWALAQGAKRVVAVEPDPKCFKELNGLYSAFPISAHNLAVYSKENVVPFTVYDDKTSVNHIADFDKLFSSHKSEHTIHVETIHINELIENMKSEIDLIKIDCEGSEQDIFETISDKNLGKVKKFIIEAHSTGIKNQIEHKLKESNFEVYIKSGVDPKYEHGLYNIYAIKKEL